MPEAQSAAGAPAATDAQPPAGTTDAPAATEDDGAAPSETASAISLDEAKKLRTEAKSLRTRLKAYEEAEAARADADKSAEQRAADRIAALETELATERSTRQAMALQVATIGVARKLGFRDPDLAHQLLNAAEVEYDESGTPRNVERLLADRAKQYPYLINGTSDYGGGPRGTPGAATSDADMNALIRRRTGRA